ncbi:MAG: hypothetical protein IPI24_14130 [Ignavibacteria bacterium]|nr:hypothetical protein [Ignavibacteria bacterium]MBK7578538.1 hypothetical protein [Ignavibacteria bacterium]
MAQVVTAEELQSFSQEIGLTDEGAGKYPVSFVVIASMSDMHEHLQGMMRTLPPNAEVCILVNEEGDQYALSDIDEKTTGTMVIRSRKWTYPKGQFSFADARNLAHEMATHDWCFWMDCDERLPEFQHHGIREAALTFGGGIGGVMGGQASLSTANIIMGVDTEHMGDYMNIRQCRMYRRSTGAKWEGHCHEQIYNSIREAGYTVRASTITIVHNGYSISRETLLAKIRRNITLLCRTCHEFGEAHNLSGYYRACLHRELSSLKLMEPEQWQQGV